MLSCITIMRLKIIDETAKKVLYKNANIIV